VEYFYPQFSIDLSAKSFTLRVKSVQTTPHSELSGTFQCLPKPFLLLAGISGTGKSRFVKNQALMQCDDASNYLPVSVRPDWHEPSDLLGYVTRIGGERYQCSPFLKFIVQAWIESIESVNLDAIELRPLSEIVTYWVCLDEMNLAPVEQYFADYLSVIESRKWDGQKYTCDPLINPGKLTLSSDSLNLLRSDLGLDS
jgi:5-methylcytosine-specific restriction endonuclease McrBC GTP-binding regulatory subunit McrB